MCASIPTVILVRTLVKEDFQIWYERFSSIPTTHQGGEEAKKRIILCLRLDFGSVWIELGLNIGEKKAFLQCINGWEFQLSRGSLVVTGAEDTPILFQL